MPGIFDAFTPSESLPDPLPVEPFALFGQWFREAIARADQPNPNAMTLATCTPDGLPSARIVLCKDLDPQGGTITFYTNYESKKGRELAANPRAACTFLWDAQARQVRLEGAITRTSAAESDAYFDTRAWESRLGAWASAQSQPIESREALLERVAEVIERLGLDLGALMTAPETVIIPRPPHWGGFRLRAERVELWSGGTGRIHDRACWQRTTGGWTGTRLQP